MVGSRHPFATIAWLVHSLGQFAIVAWYGAIENIPVGWGICDGTNGTPDLRDKFLVAAGDTYNPDDTGGSAEHNHDFTGDGHNHELEFGTTIQMTGYVSKAFTNANITGTTDNESSLPPFLGLVYIMEL